MNPDFYLPIFTRFEAADRAGLSWNTAAGLLTFNWLVYRQLWGAALGYAGIVLALVLLVFGIGRLVFQLSDNLTMALSLGLSLACVAVPGLLGNALLQKECRKRMAKALADHAVLADARLDLQRQSSSRLRILWVAMANLAVLGLVAFIYVQVSTLNTLAVMPQGALDAGHVAPGLATSSTPLSAASTPSAAASAAPAPVVAASVPDAAASAPSTNASAPSIVPQPALAASASTPVMAASAAQPASAAPINTTAPAASAPAAASSAAVKPAGIPAPSTAAQTLAKSAAKPVPAMAKLTPDKPRPVPKAASQPEPKVPAKTPPVAKSAAAKPEALFYINVGLFSKPQNAARVHAQLLEAKLPSVMKELQSPKERQIRVRVGPFATEAQAEVAAEKIKTMKFDAGVIQQ